MNALLKFAAMIISNHCPVSVPTNGSVRLTAFVGVTYIIDPLSAAVSVRSLSSFPDVILSTLRLFPKPVPAVKVGLVPEAVGTTPPSGILATSLSSY